MKSGDNVGMKALGSSKVNAARHPRRILSGEASDRPSWGETLARASRSGCAALLGSLALIAAQSAAHPLSLQECFEGGDFIAHAAQARDNGMTKAAFSDKLLADVYLVQAFPRELRWFVQDPEDAEFLLAEATMVFDRPRASEAHRTDFLSRCFDRKLSTGPSMPARPGEDPRPESPQREPPPQR
jgi:hypothetical protein